MNGISMVLFPITSSWKELPTNDIDIIAKAQNATTVEVLAKTRIVPFADPVEDIMAMLDDPRFFVVTARGTRVTTPCGAPHRGFRGALRTVRFLHR